MIDTSCVLAVALNEPVRVRLLATTANTRLSAPSILSIEVGNALSKMVKRNRLTATDAMEAWDVVGRFLVHSTEVDERAALLQAVRNGMFAYDAYFLQAAIELGCPLLTLDRPLVTAALRLGIEVSELK